MCPSCRKAITGDENTRVRDHIKGKKNTLLKKLARPVAVKLIDKVTWSCVFNHGSCDTAVRELLTLTFVGRCPMHGRDGTGVVYPRRLWPYIYRVRRAQGRWAPPCVRLLACVVITHCNGSC